MNLLVCGSRKWPSPEVVEDILGHLAEEYAPVKIIHGGAKGADDMAHNFCVKHRVLEEIFFADWEKYGRGAGYIRNNQMLNTGPDLVLAFHCENSSGTSHTVRQAKDRGLPVWVIYPGTEG